MGEAQPDVAADLDGTTERIGCLDRDTGAILVPIDEGRQSQRRGKHDDSRRLSTGKLLEFERVYPIDAAYDALSDVPEAVRDSKRYAGRGDFTIDGAAQQLIRDFGDRPLDIVVHSLANGPEVHLPLSETSRSGYLAAVSVSAYSMVSMIRRFSPLMRRNGSFLSLTYLASERVIPGYGGGMNAAKAALESDTRVLAYEAGRKYGVRINTIFARTTTANGGV